MVALRFIAFLSFIALCCATPTYRDFVLHDRRDAVPKGFVSGGPAAKDTTLNLRISLTSSNLAGLEKALYDVSTPSSPLYGQHLSKEEVEAFVAPSSQTTNAVNEWLSSNGVKATTVSPAGDWLTVSIDVEKANQMFNADFTVFKREDSGEEAIRTLAYSVPSALKEHIELVHPTVAFPIHTGGAPLMIAPAVPSPTAETSNTADTVSSSCNTQISPSCLQALYGIPAGVTSQNASRIGVPGFVDQWAQTADLQAFLRLERPDLDSSLNFAYMSLDEGDDPQSSSDAGFEANLDIQYTVGMAGGVPVTFMSVGTASDDGVSGFMDIIQYLIAAANPPQVLTISYGFNEPDLPSSIANSLCNAYMQLGARGVSLFFSSGDGGSAGAQSQSCTSFIPTFPAGCPYITSVGGTTLVNPETAADFSSGGFSNLFAQPSYQSSAVATYLKALGTTNSGKFNRTGRGFPDLSAQAQNVIIYEGGITYTVSGTSCASPIVASIFGLLNAQLLAAKRPVVGFLNPFIYANPGVFTDITTGSNPGCGTSGFPALAGWDPVTGVGTPVFANLQRAFGL